jgi:hypothetical protein
MDYNQGYQDAVNRLETVIGDMMGDGSSPTDIVLNGILEQLWNQFNASEEEEITWGSEEARGLLGNNRS